MQQKGRRDVICQNPRYATGSAEASDHLRNTLAPHSRESPFEIIQIQEALPGLGNSYYLQGSFNCFIKELAARRMGRPCTQRDDCERQMSIPACSKSRIMFLKLSRTLKTFIRNVPRSARNLLGTNASMSGRSRYIWRCRLPQNKDIYNIQAKISLIFYTLLLIHDQIARPLEGWNRQ